MFIYFFYLLSSLCFRFKTRKVIIHTPHHQWQCDLNDLPNIKKFNKNYRYILLVIDLFTKKAFGRCLKTKSKGETTQAFKEIIEESGKIPKLLQHDQGFIFY